MYMYLYSYSYMYSYYVRAVGLLRYQVLFGGSRCQDQPVELAWSHCLLASIAAVAHGLHSASRVPCVLHPDVRIVHPQYKHHEFEWILCVSRAVKR